MQNLIVIYYAKICKNYNNQILKYRIDILLEINLFETLNGFCRLF